MLPNIFKKPEILDKEKHKELALSTYPDYSFTKDAYLVPLGIHEMNVAMKSLVIVFIKDKSGEVSPAAVLGGEESSNILIDENGKWKENTYIPAALRSYPFGIAMGSNGEKFISVDSDAEVLKDLSGTRIFDNDMNLTKEGEHAFNFVQEAYSKIEDAKVFAKEVESYGLMKQANIEITKGEDTHSLTKGVYIVDENALNKLESRKIKKLASKGVLPFIYAHLFSLSNRY